MQQLPDYFNTIDSSGTAEFKERGSKFISIAIPVKDVESCKRSIANLKKQYPKASHYCFAYRLGLNDDLFRISDDGEPSGTAGRPILGQIDSKNVTNILIVVVRYFGGTLLGVPGLINAYKSAAALVLQITPIIRKPILIFRRLEFNYTQMNEVMVILKQFGCEIQKQDLQLFCIMDIGIPHVRLTETLKKLNEVSNINITVLSNFNA